MKTVYIIAEHLMFAAGLEYLLQQHALAVVGSETDWTQAVDQIQACQPEVVILYSQTPRQDGERLLARLPLEASPAQVISLSVHDNQMYIQQQHRFVAYPVTGLADVLAVIDPHLVSQTPL